MGRNGFVFCVLAAFLAVVAGVAHADAKMVAVSSPYAQKCTMNETASVSISFSNMAVDLKQMHSVMDQKISDTKALAVQAGVETADLQSYNYNVYSSGSGQAIQYQSSGNINYNVSPGAKAPDFAALLIEKGYTASLNVNAYKQCQ